MGKGLEQGPNIKGSDTVKYFTVYWLKMKDTVKLFLALTMQFSPGLEGIWGNGHVDRLLMGM
jgi:hypothetical protein